VVSDNSPSNLLRRDADVAVRMFRPEQQELVARKVAEASLALYASPDYLEFWGRPTGLADFASHTFLGLDRDDLAVRTLRAMGVEVRREDFAVRTDCQSLHVEAARAGLGVAGVQCAIAHQLGGLVRVMEDLPFPPMPVWLVAHPDVKRSARVRAVFDVLAEGLPAFYEGDDDGAAAAG